MESLKMDGDFSIEMKIATINEHTKNRTDMFLYLISRTFFAKLFEQTLEKP